MLNNRQSLPAIANNAAAPLSAAIQLSLLAHARAHATATEATSVVAAYTAVNSAITFATNLVNFIVVVVVARVSHALGARDWSVLGTTVRAAIVSALCAGAALALALYVGRIPLFMLMSLHGGSVAGEQGETAASASGASASGASASGASATGASIAFREAQSYLPWALLRLPPLLLLKALSSVLVGYGRIGLASALSAALAASDAIAFYVALRVLTARLDAAAAALAANCAIGALVALGAVWALPPVEANGRVCLWRGPTDPPGGGRSPPGSPVVEAANSTNSSYPPGGGRPPPGSPPVEAATSTNRSLLSLARDSLNVLIRSALLSGSGISHHTTHESAHESADESPE